MRQSVQGKRIFPGGQNSFVPHFAKLFAEHDILDKKIVHLELDPVNHNIYDDIELMKRKKLKMKDELYLLLQQASN